MTFLLVGQQHIPGSWRVQPPPLLSWLSSRELGRLFSWRFYNSPYFFPGWPGSGCSKFDMRFQFDLLFMRGSFHRQIEKLSFLSQQQMFDFVGLKQRVMVWLLGIHTCVQVQNLLYCVDFNSPPCRWVCIPARLSATIHTHRGYCGQNVCIPRPQCMC